MEKEVLPDKFTKKMLFELYKPIPEKVLRSYVNYYILEMGKNVRIRILPELVKLNIFIEFGIPNGYKLNEKLQIKFEKLNEIRTEKS